jgi:hypothetical protein
MTKKNIEPIFKVNEHLNGLLLKFKESNTYFKICVNQVEKLVRIQMTDNPLNWKNIPDEWMKDFTEVRRIDMNVSKLFTNYISPIHIVDAFGPCLGVSMPLKQITIINNLNDEENNYYFITAPIRFLPDFIQFLNKIINLAPQAKLYYVEKYTAKSR